MCPLVEFSVNDQVVTRKMCFNEGSAGGGVADSLNLDAQGGRHEGQECRRRLPHLCTSFHPLAGRSPEDRSTGKSPQCSCRWSCMVLGTGNIHQDLNESDVNIKLFVSSNHWSLSSLHVLASSFSFPLRLKNEKTAREKWHTEVFSKVTYWFTL